MEKLRVFVEKSTKLRQKKIRVAGITHRRAMELHVNGINFVHKKSACLHLAYGRHSNTNFHFQRHAFYGDFYYCSVFAVRMGLE